MWKFALLSFAVGLSAAVAVAESGPQFSQTWINHVPAAQRAKVDPYLGKPADIAAGKRMYASTCAVCHGDKLQGTEGKPSLLAPVVRKATDGELMWILQNGDMNHGMPPWGVLPTQERWQIIAWIRSMQQSSPAGK